MSRRLRIVPPVAASRSIGPDEVALLMDRSPEAAILTDRHGVIVYANAAFEAMTGYTRAEAMGRTPAILRSGRHDPAFYEDLWHRIAEGGEFEGTITNRRKDGTLFHEEETIWPLFDDQGRIAWYLSCGRDVSDRVEEIERLRRAATTDPLTGLPNRTLFMDRLGLAMEQAYREAQPFLVVLVDVDRFKAINDACGHAHGDEVLRTVATRLRERIRAVDTAARLGGDEFALVLPGVRRVDAAARTLRGILRGFIAPVRVGDDVRQVSLSIGGVLCETPWGDAEALLAAADEAMYLAKHAGGNAFRLRTVGGASSAVREGGILRLGEES